MKEESCLETERQEDQRLSVSAGQDALPEQTGHCSVCQRPSYHTDSYDITHSNFICKFSKSQQCSNTHTNTHTQLFYDHYI